jgi:hypothetical protein
VEGGQAAGTRRRREPGGHGQERDEGQAHEDGEDGHQPCQLTIGDLDAVQVE